MITELYAKVLSTVLGQTARAGDLHWDADMLIAMPLKVVFIHLSHALQA